MTLSEIKTAIAEGKTVHWASEAYEVILDSIGQYLIKCTLNTTYIGLTWLDGVTLNGKEDEFFIAETKEPPFTIMKCHCGAVTIMSDAGQISMSGEDFEKHFPGVGLTQNLNEWIDCNYCINRWGIDLCYCGSGDTPEKCKCSAGVYYYNLEPVKFFVLNWLKNNL